MPPRAGVRHGVGALDPDRVALAEHAGAAHRGDIAVRLVARGFHAPVRAPERRHVGAREHLGLVHVLRRAEDAQRGAVAELPEVVVPQRGGGAQGLGIGAVVVVQADAGAPRAAVVHLQVDIHRAGQAALPDQRRHLALGAAIHGGQLRLYLREVGHGAFLQRRHLLAYLARGVVLGAHHAHAAHARLADLQEHDAAADLLLGQLDIDRLVALGLVGRRERVARALDVLHGAVRAQERPDCPLDRADVEHGIAAHDVLVDVDTPRRLRRLRRLRRSRRSHCGLLRACQTRGSQSNDRQPHRTPARRRAVLLHVMHC
ncbi:hypothetical protein D3C87_1305150 [compost metagenome]